KNGADPPCESGLRFCSTVNFTSSAVISPKPSWNCTPERSLNVHVLSSCDGFHSVASPGRYSKVFGSRMIKGSYAQSHNVFSDWLERHANGVSMPPRGRSQLGVRHAHALTATVRTDPAPWAAHENNRIQAHQAAPYRVSHGAARFPSMPAKATPSTIARNAPDVDVAAKR